MTRRYLGRTEAAVQGNAPASRSAGEDRGGPVGKVLVARMAMDQGREPASADG